MSTMICADDETALGAVASPAIDPRGPNPAAPESSVASPERGSSVEQPGTGRGPAVEEAATGPATLLDPASLNLKTLERLAIQRAMEITGGHRTNAARLLGINERTLRNKLTAMRTTVTRREDGPATHPWPPRPGSSPGAPHLADPDSPPSRPRQLT